MTKTMHSRRLVLRGMRACAGAMQLRALAQILTKTVVGYTATTGLVARAGACIKASRGLCVVLTASIAAMDKMHCALRGVTCTLAAFEHCRSRHVAPLL